MSRPDITVVLCTYNRAEMLRDALNSLMRQKRIPDRFI
jgi:glycosyltransferase involved in cell wall biosynthesis